MFYASVNISMFSVFLPSLLLCWVAAKYRQIIDNKICYLVRLGLCTTRGLVGLCKLCFSSIDLVILQWKPPIPHSSEEVRNTRNGIWKFYFQ